MSLTRFPLVLLVLALVFPTVRAKDDADEPSVRDRKLSEWIDSLQKGKTLDERRAGLLAVRLIGPRKSRKVVPALIEAARENSEEKIRAGAALALGSIAETAQADDDIRIDDIRRALAAVLRMDKSGLVRESAAKALGEIKDKGRGTARVLALALKDTHGPTRTAAANSLRRLGKGAQEAVAELQAALKDAKLERLTRVHCAFALGRIGSPDALPAVPVLKEVLSNARSDGELRKACADALGELGKDAADAVPTLATTLTSKDTDATLRRAVAYALDQMGADARPALSALQTALKDDDQFVRSLSLHAISRMGKELGDDRKMAVSGVLTCMNDNVLEVRVAAIEVLGNLGVSGLGEHAKAVAERLTQATRDPQKVVSEAAQVALKKLQGTP
jgi:HEAT repeat protein